MKCLSNLLEENMINSIQLKNWKSHKESKYEFQPGTNVLVGSMGAGKSSILQAISFALFGTFSEIKHRDIKVSDLISRGAEIPISEIQVDFTAKQKSFSVKRKIDAKKNAVEGSVRDAENKLLAGPQTTQVNEFVKRELGVDEDVFLRTVYAMQNDIDMILKLSPKERKKRIDDLMGLDKFELARNNCVTLRNRTLRQKKDSEEILESIGLDNLSKRISEINEQVESLKSKQLQFGSELSKKKVEKDTLRVNLLGAREKLSEVNKLTERKRAILKQLSEIDDKLKDKKIRSSKQEVDKEVENLKAKVRELQIQRSKFSENASSAQSEFMVADKKLALAENQLKTISEKLTKISGLKAELSGQKILDLSNEISMIKKELDTKKDAKQSNLAQLKEHRKHLEQLTLAESKCPVCSHDLTLESKEMLVSSRKSELSKILYTNTTLSEEIETIERRYKNLQELTEKNRYALEELSREDELKGEKNKLDAEINTNQKLRTGAQASLEHCKKKVSEIETETSVLTAQLSQLNDERYLYELKDQHSRANAQLELVEDDLKNKKTTREVVEELDTRFQQIIRHVQELETTLSNFENLLTEKTKQKADLASQQTRSEELKTKIFNLENKAGFLDRFRTALEATQLALRDELILAVNEVMSQVWIEIYPYEKWSGVRLSSTEQDYNLQIKEAEGEWVSVTGFASGGERMLASLAVRIAFARVLAPSLSLLILDEPTHNLDEKAIATFIDVVQNKVSDFLDQIFIVTHEEKLAENADNVIHL